MHFAKTEGVVQSTQIEEECVDVEKTNGYSPDQCVCGTSVSHVKSFHSELLKFVTVI